MTRVQNEEYTFNLNINQLENQIKQLENELLQKSITENMEIDITLLYFYIFNIFILDL